MSYAFFYQSVNGDRKYDDTSLENWLKKFFTSGVFLNDLQVTANNDMTVNVGAGYVNADGKVKIFENETTLQIETAGATYPRIDSIVLERNDAERDILLKVVKGGYSSEPVAHVPVRQDGVYQLVIAQILVGAGAVKITQTDITDTRSDMELCGFVAGAVDQIDFSQIQAQFDAYMEKYKDYIADYAEQMQADFDAWFENIRNQLDEDAAGHLQNQIDDIKSDMELIGGSNVEVAVDGGSYNVLGLTVNLEIGGKTYEEVVTPEKVAVFTGILETGTANITIIDEAQGIDASARVEIPYYGAYKAEIKCINGFEAWLSAAGYSTEQYQKVADVLADEKAVRKLMTVHASCDAFVSWYNMDSAMLAQFAEDRIAMKWIGLRDYIADKLMANPAALEQLLNSEHWGYILKDKIPAMTSNTAPEGKVNATSTFSGFNAYSAFDGKDNTGWTPASNVASASISYLFSKPIVVKKISLVMQKANSAQDVAFRLTASKDGSDWVTLDTFTTGTIEKIIDNDTPYMYYGLSFNGALAQEGVGNWELKTFQLYGRSLNESVPIMTSNTAPLGECTASSSYSSNYYPFRAFEGLANSTTGWNPADNDKFGSAYVQYEFEKPVKVGLVGALYKDTSRTFTYKVMASNDGVEFTPIIDSMEIKPSLTDFALYETNADKAYKYYRFVYMSNSANAIGTGNGAKFQMYGVSYSEEEFGTDAIEMLYDNGVEVANVSIYQEENATVTKENDYVISKSNTSAANSGGISATVELSGGYSYLIGEYNEKFTNGTYVFVRITGFAGQKINANTNVESGKETLTSGKLVLDASNMSNVKEAILAQFSSNIDIELAKLRKLYLIK